MAFLVRSAEKPPEIVALPAAQAVGQKVQDFARTFVVVQTADGLEWREKTWRCIVDAAGNPIKPLTVAEQAELPPPPATQVVKMDH